jgi:hypothetical protein
MLKSESRDTCPETFSYQAYLHVAASGVSGDLEVKHNMIFGGSFTNMHIYLVRWPELL